MRRALTAMVIAATLLPGAARASVAVLVIEGRGWGHGVGMAQDGAYWMGRSGSTTEQILGHFYPGTALGQAGGAVRVPVLDAGAAPTGTLLELPQGGEIRDARSGAQSPGFPVTVSPGGRVRVSWSGRSYRVEPAGGASASRRTVSLAATLPAQSAPPPTVLPPAEGTTTTTAPAVPSEPGTTTTTTTAPPPPPTDEEPQPARAAETGRPVWAVPADGGLVAVPERGRRYRGVVEATAGGGTLRLVNEVAVEDYLRGMGEVRDPAWPPAALRAQAIAARTYALRAMAVSGEVCDTQRCQVYLGADAEYRAMDAAVAATARRVLVHGRRLASAVYSANAGGFSATSEEGFGTAGPAAPYLRAAPYPTQDPMPWTVTVALDDVARRFGYRGDLHAVRVSRTGPSGRALEVALEGTAGPLLVPGIAFDAGLGLRSTLFSLRVEQAVAPPEPPPPAEAMQAPPEIAGEEMAPRLPMRASRSAPAALALPREPGTPRSTSRPEELIVLAGWMVVAAAGALVVIVRRPPT